MSAKKHSIEKHLLLLLLLPATLLKRDSCTSVSCEFCEISNTFFTEHLWTTASNMTTTTTNKKLVTSLYRKSTLYMLLWITVAP